MFLGGAITTNQLPFVVNYRNVNLNNDEAYDAVHGATNNTTAVTLLAAPKVGEKRIIDSLSIQNADTASATVTVRLNDNGTTRSVEVNAVAAGVTLHYERGTGWYKL